ncbi:unnamed protein product [Ilex paraguariensis]|uniref:Non-haem dioxygenase N-terminal domain-containing protein n=1 Tax=Ilex paraguariensis TaxID=185542 RepID=A0ABC8UW84_9AQUA
MGSDVEEIAREEQDVPTYAASIPVPNVQEMVKGDPSHIPERYVRNQEDMPKTTYMKSLSSKIPVIDLSLLSNGHEEELKKLDQALKEWGFFQVVNHGVSERVLQGMKNAAAGFFNLPLDEKNKFSMPSNDIQCKGMGMLMWSLKSRS